MYVPLTPKPKFWPLHYTASLCNALKYTLQRYNTLYMSGGIIMAAGRVLILHDSYCYYLKEEIP